MAINVDFLSLLINVHSLSLKCMKGSIPFINWNVAIKHLLQHGMGTPRVLMRGTED